MYVLQNLHWFIIFIGVLVFIHELGHFLVAKGLGVKVLRFSFGFGPKLLGTRWGETEYWISALPLGGYVKMLGELPGSPIPEEDAPRAFSAKPVWQRAAVVIAGPAFNLVLALVIYFGLNLGNQTFLDTRLGIVSWGEPAWQAGLRPGDKILSIDDNATPTWDDLRKLISTRPGDSLRVTLERAGEQHVVTMVPRAQDELIFFETVETRGRVGISPFFVKPILGVVDADSPAARVGLQTGDLVTRVNEKPVAAWHELRAAVRDTPENEPVTLEIRRPEGIETVRVTPGDFPALQLETDVFSAADTPWGYTGLVSKESLVAEVDAQTPAAGLGLAVGDRLLRLAMESERGRVERPIGVWFTDLAAFQGVEASNDFALTFQRGNRVLSKPLKLVERTEKDELKFEHRRHVFGARNDRDTLDTYTFERTVGPAEALVSATQDVITATTAITTGLAKLIQREIPFRTVGGPIMLFDLAAKSAQQGFRYYLGMLALISVNLGLLNLLPIPVLDGGHLMLFTVEAVRRRPPSMRFREIAHLVGLALVLLLMALVIGNDILRHLGN